MNSSHDSDAPGPLSSDLEVLPSLPAVQTLRFPAGKMGRWVSVSVTFAMWFAAFRIGNSWVYGAAALGSLALVLVPPLHARMLWRPTLTHSEEQFARLRRGAFDEAAAAQESFLADAGAGFQHVVALHDLGYYELLRGNFKRALSAYSETYRRLAKSRGPTAEAMRNACRNSLANTLAIQGEVDAAQAWLPESADAPLGYLKGPILCRAGRFEEVLKLAWPVKTQGALEAPSITKRSFYLFQAFARQQMDPDDPALKEVLECARPEFAGEYDYLRKLWPELANFIDEFVGEPQPRGATFPAARVISDEGLS